MVLTKEELDGQDWWNQNVVLNQKNPVDSMRSLSVFSFSYFHFLFQTPHMRDFSQCLLDPILSMSGILARDLKMSSLKIWLIQEMLWVNIFNFRI